MSAIILWSILGALILAVAKCFNILGPNWMGIKTTWGKPDDEGVDSGPCWIWWPIQRLTKYTKEQMRWTFTATSIMTKQGKVEGYKEEIEPTEIDIKCTILAYFDKEKLNRTIQKAPGATAKDLAGGLIPYAKDTIRAIGGRIPWRLINQERRYFSEWIIARFLPYDLGYPKYEQNERGEWFFNSQERNQNLTEDILLLSSPFVQFGLKNLTFVFEDISFLDPELRKAVNAPEKARLQAQATMTTAKAERIKRTEEGKGDAAGRSAMVKVIKEYPDLEVLLTLREMAQGTSNTILYQVPAAFENRVRDMLGGNSPGEVFRTLSKDNQKLVQEVIAETIKKLNKSKGGE